MLIKNPINNYLLEVVCDLKLVLLGSNVRFDFSIGIVNDGQEHVEQDEEHEEHVGNEEGWSEDTVGVLDLMEVKVTENDTEQGKARMSNKYSVCYIQAKKNLGLTNYLISTYWAYIKKKNKKRKLIIKASLYLHAVLECAEITDLGSKYQVA